MTAETARARSTRERFESSLSELDVELIRTEPEGFDDALREAVREPAIAASLPFESVSVPEWIDAEPTPATLESAATGVTAASIGIADYGTVVLPYRPDGSEQVSLFPELHVAVLRERDLVDDMRTAIERLGPRLRDGESAILATGPSATADMGALVKGAHGPEAVRVILLSDGEVSDDE